MLDEYDFSKAKKRKMKTTDKVTVNDNTAGTTSSTTYTYTNSPNYYAEKGWECPRCRRINAPWVRQCDCNGNEWTITNIPNTSSPWWTQLPTTITCKDTPNTTYYSSPVTIGHADSSSCVSDKSSTVKVQAFNNTKGVDSVSCTRATPDNPWNQFITPTANLDTKYCLNQYTIEQLNPPRGGSSQQDD